MSILSIFKRSNTTYQLTLDYFENIKFEDISTADELFASLSYLLKNYKLGNITLITIQNCLVELIVAINKNSHLSKVKKNKFINLLFQELKAVQMKFSDDILIINNVKLDGYILHKLKLRNIIFLGCTFDSTDFFSSTFVKCEFRGCTFIEADLTNVVFKKTKFLGCDFENAIIDKTVGLK